MPVDSLVSLAKLVLENNYFKFEYAEIGYGHWK